MANRRRRIIWSKVLLYIVAVATFVGIAIVSVLGYRDWSMNRLTDDDMMSKLRQHIILPKGEPKKVIRINNIDALRAQSDFYKDLEEGDFIIIYAKKAYIYDSRNDIVRDVIN